MENRQSHYMKSKISPFLLLFSIAAFAPGVSAESFDEYISDARAAYQRYDFAEAARQLANARKKMKGDDLIEKEESSLLQSQLNLAKSFIERVEKITVLDSISVDKAAFFKAYRLPASAGYLSDASSLPHKANDVEYVFTNEGEDFKMWAQPDSTGFFNIMESIRLTDGKWSEPVSAPDELRNGGNAEFPFMMADGVTLYYASDGEESLGGYDIFIATRDAATGEYLQPMNMGMPYNSPFDDYLLAIDELNGVGWWATDRNQLGENLTVYLFKVNDTRRNYDPDEEEANIADLALISDFHATQDPEEDYTELIESVRNISVEKKKKVDFYFPMKGGVVMTSLDDFQTSGGRAAMRKYLEAEKRLNEMSEELKSLRRDYARVSSSSLGQHILDLEKEIEAARVNLKALRNAVYKAEI